MKTTTAAPEKTRYEAFIEDAHRDMDAYREKLHGNGTFCYVTQVLDLQRLSYYLNQSLLEYLFGDILGAHLADKFVNQHNRNLLSFLSKLTSEYRFFILYELKTNESLLAYC